ncbi:DEAD/DEAH box helicase [Aeromonas rivipollensis]|uniref:DEAD/DEAH box helicase n=1 Tax=Aeromonas rivipollensis TaxID=948519 RepID=UPI0030D492D7
METSFSWILNHSVFENAIGKLTINAELSDSEKEVILSCAILFIKDYCQDKRNLKHFKFGYYLVLKYCVNYNDYQALFDISANFGLFPITKFIIDNELYSNINSMFGINYQLKNYEYKGIIETLEQKNSRIALTETYHADNALIAPTSFGKSSLIVEIIKNSNSKKIAIIVPTKSLLAQTYRLISNHIHDRNIIFHDEMYDDEDSFICVFTQERALRLMKRPDVYFDTIIIDEAHNLFEFNGRSILLSRVIRKNKLRNNASKFFYLSPLISNADNLKTEKNQNINSFSIHHNIKEPEIFEYLESGENRQYNRYVDRFYTLPKTFKSYNHYIMSNLKNKNFLYLKRPKMVETFALEMYGELESKDSPELLELSKIISENIHAEFYCVECIKKGIIYLHGKLPDLAKEFLEYKFKTLTNLNVVIANSVILEGVNFPIDNLFILNTHGLKAKDLINLIGRVNRLDSVFNKDDGSLSKLLPYVHFVNSTKYSKINSKMENKIKALKKMVIKDEVKNPTLINFNYDGLHQEDLKSSDDDKDEFWGSKEDVLKRIHERENFLLENDNNDKVKAEIAFIESGIDSIYTAPQKALETIKKRAAILVKNPLWTDTDTIDKIHAVFIDGLTELISDFAFKRLQHEAARNFYKLFINQRHTLSLKEHIDASVLYYLSIKNKPIGKSFYIGTSFGEIAKQDSFIRDRIDLSQKTYRELVNIALVKIKIENDFVSFTLNEYVKLLLEMSVIPEDEYNLFIYGSKNKEKSKLGRLGLSGLLISKLEKDHQLGNLIIDHFGRLIANDEFLQYINKQNEFIQFEIRKFLITDNHQT